MSNWKSFQVLLCVCWGSSIEAAALSLIPSGGQWVVGSFQLLCIQCSSMNVYINKSWVRAKVHGSLLMEFSSPPCDCVVSIVFWIVHFRRWRLRYYCKMVKGQKVWYTQCGLKWSSILKTAVTFVCQRIWDAAVHKGNALMMLYRATSVPLFSVVLTNFSKGHTLLLCFLVRLF